MTTLLCDGNNVMHRSMHGSPPLTREADGRSVGGVVGFVRTLCGVLETRSITRGAVVFDGPGRGFRKYLSTRYKAGRDRLEWTEDEQWQVTAMMHVGPALGLSTLRSSPYEADDVIATLAHQHSPAVVASDDKDLGYLTCVPGVTIHRFRDVSEWHKGGERGEEPGLLGAANVQRRWGVPPHLVTCLQALSGDGGDGVPGLPGVGKKTAAGMILTHGSLELVATCLDAFQGKGWAARAAAPHDVRRMRDSVTSIHDCVFDGAPTSLHRDWPLRAASVLGALGSKRALGEHCRLHGIKTDSVRPHAGFAAKTGMKSRRSLFR